MIGKGNLYIPNILTVKPSTKIDQKLLNSFFQMSNIDAQYLQFDIETKAIYFRIVSTSCVYPTIIASSSLISFIRDNESPFSLTLDNLVFSSFQSFINQYQQYEIGKDYMIPMKRDNENYFKFFYVICPFYNSSEMNTVIRVASILASEDITIIDIDNNNTYPVEYNSIIPFEQFIQNAQENLQVVKFNLENLMKENFTNNMNLNFNQTSKYLLFIKNPKIEFKIESKKLITYKIIKTFNQKNYELIKQGKNTIFKFDISEFNNKSDFYFYVEKSNDSVADVELYIETFGLIKDRNASFFSNFWGYFIVALLSIVSVVIIWVIIQKFTNKKRLKKIQENLDLKLREQHTIEIQKQSERFSEIFGESKENLNSK